MYVCGGGVSSCISSETRKCPRGWFLISFFFSKDHTSFQVRWTEGPLRRGTFFPTSQDTGELGTNTMLSKHRMEPLPSDAWVGSQARAEPLYMVGDQTLENSSRFPSQKLRLQRTHPTVCILLPRLRKEKWSGCKLFIFPFSKRNLSWKG